MPIIAAPRRRRLAVAACLLLLALSGCSDQERRGAGSPGDTPATTMPPSAAEGTPAGTPTPTPTRVTVAPTSTATSAAAVVVQQPPVIRSIVATPHRVDPFACSPPDPPERPEVVVRVDGPGHDLATMVVTLSYGVFGADYQGEVRMRYDQARKAFTHRLPPVSRSTIGARAKGISLSVQAANPSIRLAWVPPPTTGWIGVASRCTVIP